MVIYLIIGWYVGRKVKSLDDYYVAGRNAPTLFIVGTLVASFMSTNAFLGELGMSYSGHAPLIIIMTGGNCLGYLFGALFFGRYLRRANERERERERETKKEREKARQNTRIVRW